MRFPRALRRAYGPAGRVPAATIEARGTALDGRDRIGGQREGQASAAGAAAEPVERAGRRRRPADPEFGVARGGAERLPGIRRQRRGASPPRSGPGGVDPRVGHAPRAIPRTTAGGGPRSPRGRVVARLRRPRGGCDATVRVAARSARGGVRGGRGPGRCACVAYGGVGARAGVGNPGRDRGAGGGGADDAGPARHVGRRLAGRAPHRESGAAAGDHGGRGRRTRQPLLSLVRAHEHRRRDSRRLLSHQRDVRTVPPGHLRAVERVGAPFLVLQQPVVPALHRVHAGRGGHTAIEVVRRLPRSRRVLQRALRPADPRADRHARSAGGAGLHLLPLDRARRRHDGAGGLHRRVPAAARPGRQRGAVVALGARSGHRARPGAPPAHVPETVPSRGQRRVLLFVPQGPSGRAGERLPLDPRLQRVRQLAGVRGVGAGRPLVLLPGEAAHLQRLPHAAGAVGRSGRRRRLRAFAPLPGGEHGAAVRQRRRRAVADRAGLPAGRADLGGRVRNHAGGRDPAAGSGERAERRAAAGEHVRGGRGVRPFRRRGRGDDARRGDRAPRSGPGRRTPRRVGPGGGGGPDAQGGALLSRRHRRRFRRVGGVRGRRRHRARAAAQRRGGRRRQRAGGSRRPLLPQPAARRARQPDRQAQRLDDPFGRLCPS